MRVDRLLTRSEWAQVQDIKIEKHQDGPDIESFSFGPNLIDFINLKAQSREGTFDLTLQEIKILKVFIRNPKIPLTREEILEKAVGYDRGVSTRTLDNFIVRFRKYFEVDPKNPKFFKSVRSVGYLFDPS